jgi:hypothetical protein
VLNPPNLKDFSGNYSAWTEKLLADQKQAKEPSAPAKKNTKR